jgi:hypothetical protein
VKGLKYKYLLGVAAVALAVPAMSGAALADPQLDAVLQRLDKLEKENAKLKNDIKSIENKTTKAPVSTASVGPQKGGPAANGFVQVAMPKASYGVGTPAENVNYTSTKDGEDDDWYFRHKPGSNLTFMTPNGQVTAYGRIDLAVQDTTPGIAHLACTPPSCGTVNYPVGNMGWLPALGSPTSYVGIRGEQYLGGYDAKFIYQLEMGMSLSAQAGIRQTNSQESDTVAGALTSRNSWVGFEGYWGSIKGGKSSSPYENSTRMMNPFAGMLGTMGVIMGNTGGDNRDEFASMMDHSLWYESPNIKVAGGDFSFASMFQFGQNRANNSDNIALGETDCTGGNIPASGGFATCSDGSWDNAISLSATYQTKFSLGGGGWKDSGDEIGLLVTAAYERHFQVNRQSDLLAIYGVAPQGGTYGFISPNGPCPVGGPVSPTCPAGTAPNGLAGSQLALYNQDVADEDAWKIGAQVKLPTNTTVSAIFESMHRYVAADLEFQNERTRNGTWLAVSQDVTPEHNVAFGWGHAFKTPGDPCQHNDCTLTTTDTFGVYAPNDNSADMLTVAWQWKFHPGMTWYVDYAATINAPSAHYDLGQGSGLQTDCHDASGAIGGVGTPGPGGSNPHCWTGGLVQGIQTGVRYQF